MDASYNINGGFKPMLKRFADLDGPDFFPTPAWATYALIDNERFRGDIWECACGDGAMSRVLENAAREENMSDAPPSIGGGARGACHRPCRSGGRSRAGKHAPRRLSRQ